MDNSRLALQLKKNSVVDFCFWVGSFQSEDNRIKKNKLGVKII